MVNINMTVFLRSPQIATRAFGLGSPGQVVTAVPRIKFLFFVKFVLSADGMAMTKQADLNTYNGNRGISFKVKQVDKPKTTLTTVDLNQYNKKKLAYTKIEYAEASMRLYDSVDDSVLALWVDYFTYFFGDSRIKTNHEYMQSSVGPFFADGSGWGLRPLGEQTTFFDKITVYAFYANTYTAFSYMNPKITSVDWQQKDYSSSDMEELTLNFKYEAIQYEKFAKPYNPFDFGWLPIDALDSTSNGTSNKSNAPIPRIFNEEQTTNQQQSTNQQTNIGNQQNPTTSSTAPTNLAPPTAVAPGAVVPSAIPSQQSAVAGGRSMSFGSQQEFERVSAYNAETLRINYQELSQAPGELQGLARYFQLDPWYALYFTRFMSYQPKDQWGNSATQQQALAYSKENGDVARKKAEAEKLASQQSAPGGGEGASGG